MPPQQKRQANQQAIQAKDNTISEYKFFDSTEALRGTSMYKKKDEIFPTLPYEFSKLEINQPFIVMDTEELLLFLKKNQLTEGSKVWISNGNMMILCSMMARQHVETQEILSTLTIHWCIRQRVIVRGDSSDFDGAIE